MITVCLIYWIYSRTQHANGLTEVSFPAPPLSFFLGHLLIAPQMRVLISSLCDFIMDYIRINVPHLPSPVGR